jgi:hypothetical protein
MKPFKEDDLKIIDVTERMENTNESQINELGQSYKRNTVDAKKLGLLLHLYVRWVMELRRM